MWRIKELMLQASVPERNFEAFKLYLNAVDKLKDMD